MGCLSWEGSTRSVLIGNKSMVETTDLLGLSATDIIKGSYGSVDVSNNITIKGQSHSGLVMRSGGEHLTIKYRLNKAYEEFSTSLMASETLHVTIVGDGTPLWQGHVLSNSNPVDINISTKNVQNLEFRIDHDTSFSRTAYFINPLLSK